MAQAKYFRAFPAVEIDSTFYNLPRLETAARWRAAAPADFTFMLKAWQVITHRASSPTYKRTRLDPRDREYCGHFGFNGTIRWAWDQTFAVATVLRAKLVLFQCSVSFRPTAENITALRRFFEKAKRGKFQMGWEPRGEWDAELIAKLCKELDLVHVTDPLQCPPATTRPLRYFRLHGQPVLHHHYSPEELRRLKEICAGRSPCYCLFNNASMVEDAQRFQRLVGA